MPRRVSRSETRAPAPPDPSLNERPAYRADSVLPPAPLVDPSYASVPSFFGLPRFELTERIPGADVVLSGLPYDGGAVNRSGGRFAPRAVRDASFGLGLYSEALGIQVGEEIRAVDGGDVPIGRSEIGPALDAIATRAEAIARSGVIGGFVGGDQTVTLGVLRGIHRAKLKGVGLVHLDASSDSLGAAGSRDIHHHSAIRMAVEEGLIREGGVIQIGLRGPHFSEAEREFAAAKEFEVVKTDDVKWDLHAAVSQLRKMVRQGSLYVSVDVSVLDPAYAPAAASPRPGGLTTWELQQLLRALVGAQIVGFDVVEIVPPYDPSGVTALAGAGVLHELLSVIADTQRSARPAPSSRGRRRGRRMSP